MTAAQDVAAEAFRDAFDVALAWFELNREAINAINVYPVPDGDTGTNMLLTLRAARRAAAEREDGAGEAAAGVGAFARALAEGALLGARGNSGVILSQMLRGLADGLEGRAALGPADLGAALAAASDAAYAAVGDPVEGTMLTVLRDAAGAAAAPDGGGASLAALLATTVEAARESVARTPDLLPRLRDAGVVDAGGEGVAVLLEGLRLGVAGEPLPPPPETPAGAVDLAGVGHEGHGYCVEYLVRGEALAREALAEALTAIGGESLLVVGDASTLHVHVHAEEPDAAIEAGGRFGEVANVKAENMQAQHEEWAAGHERAGEAPPVGLVAVAQGEGLRAAFRELGATAIVDGGATNNPSAGDLLEAALAAGSEHAFLLPNDPNVVMAAEQAAARDPGRVTVVPARSVAAGLAAAVAFVPGEAPLRLGERLAAAAAAVRCVEVTTAVRDASVDGVAVRAGDAIALVDGALRARSATPEEALLLGLAHAVGEDGEVVTLILGADAPEDAADSIPPRIEAAHPGVEVEVVRGGQPHYPYLAGVE